MTFVTDKIGLQAKGAGDQLLATAGNLRTIGEQLRADHLTHGAADLAILGAERIEDVGRYLSTSDLETLLQDAETYSRKRPWTVAIGGLALGISLSRLIKATAARRAFADAEQSTDTNDGSTYEDRAPLAMTAPRRRKKSNSARLAGDVRATG